MKSIRGWREKRRVMKGLAMLRIELAKGFSKSRYYTEGQVINTGVSLGLDASILEYAVAFYVEPKDAAGALEKMGASKTTREIAAHICVWYGVPSLFPEGCHGSLSNAISEFYDAYIASDVTSTSLSSRGGSDSGISAGLGDDGGGDVGND